MVQKLLTPEDVKLRTKMRREGGRVFNFMHQFDVVEHLGLADGTFVCVNSQRKVVKVMRREDFQRGLEIHPDTAAVFCDPDSWEQMHEMLPLMKRSLASGMEQALHNVKLQ